MSEDASNIREKLLSNGSYKASQNTFYQSGDPAPGEANSKENNFPLNKEISDVASDAKNFKFDELTNMNIWGYGVGHFINDLAAAGWFNYLTIYLKSINPIDPKNAGFYAGYYLLYIPSLTVY